MSNPLLEEIIEEELEKAVEVKDKEALKRYIRIIVNSFSETNDIKDLGYKMKISNPSARK